jgi:hypothetical protein
MLLNRLFRFITSLKLTVACLGLGIILVFWGTLAQVHLGLYKAQNEFFRSFFIYWQPEGSSLKIPIFPGGYLVGGVLLINLFAAHTRYYKSEKRKIGIIMIHAGIVLLLVGQLLTDMLSAESSMHLRIGETKNYSEADRTFELAIVDVTDSKSDKVVAIPEQALVANAVIKDSRLPFTVRTKRFFHNAALSSKPETGYEEVPATQGIGTTAWWKEVPRETIMERRDIPAAAVEIVTPQGAIGTWLVSGQLDRSQSFSYNGRNYEITLRLVRFYKPFSLHLVEFKHDKYPGTDIPKNFSSRVRLNRSDSGENREVLIYMNNPLRYWGETYYQASFDADDQGSILQVVRNPSWLTPYFSCVLVAVGLIWQFLAHLIPFLKRRLKS